MNSALITELAKNDVGQTYDGHGRKIVKLPQRSPDPYDGSLEDLGPFHSATIAEIMADEDASRNHESADPYAGVVECMKRDVGKVRSSGGGGRTRKKVVPPNLAARRQYHDSTIVDNDERLCEDERRGRKSIPEETRRVVVSISVAASSARRIKEQLNRGKYIDSLIAEDIAA